jgi:hypothetical protein
MYEVFLGLLNRLGDSHWNFGSLSLAYPHPAVTVSDDHQGAEVKSLPAFNDFGNSIDKDHFVF